MSHSDARIKPDHYRENPAKARTVSTSPFIHGRPLDIDLPLHVTEIEMGSPSGATFLMLHGFGASSFTWRHWAPKLSKRGRVLCVDYKGFGAAPKPSSDSYELADQAKTVVQLVDQLGLGRVTLVGHSLGGGIALLVSKELCRRTERRLDCLVLVSSLAYGQRLSPFIPLSRNVRLSRFLVRILGPQRLVRWVLHSIVHDPGVITSEMVDAYALPLRTRPGVDAALATGRSILVSGTKHISDRISEIDVPTLLMWGANEKVIPHWVGERLAEELPDAKLVTIQQCGHIPPEEAPDQSFSILSRFLEDVEYAGTTSGNGR